MSDITDWNPTERAVHVGSVPAYDKAYPLFRRLYEQTKDIAAELSE